jgi:hypothetical protein
MNVEQLVEWELIWKTQIRGATLSTNNSKPRLLW